MGDEVPTAPEQNGRATDPKHWDENRRQKEEAQMPTKLQQWRKEYLRQRRAPRKGGRRLSDEAMRKETDKHFYGTLGPASPVKRIDPRTGEVIEILNPQQSNST
jgi:hypothetical protein